MIPYREMTLEELLSHYRDLRARLGMIRQRLAELKAGPMNLDTTNIAQFDRAQTNLNEWQDLHKEKAEVEGWLIEISDLLVDKTQ